MAFSLALRAYGEDGRLVDAAAAGRTDCACSRGPGCRCAFGFDLAWHHVDEAIYDWLATHGTAVREQGGERRLFRPVDFGDARGAAARSADPDRFGALVSLLERDSSIWVGRGRGGMADRAVL